MSHPLDPTTPDGWVPGTAADVTDLALLPGRFDAFAADVKSQLEVVTKLILPLLTQVRELVERQGGQIGDHARRLRAAETDAMQLAARVTAAESKHVDLVARIDALERAAKPRTES